MPCRYGLDSPAKKKPKIEQKADPKRRPYLMLTGKFPCPSG